MSRQCCQRWTGKLAFRGSLLSDCFYGILVRKIVVYVANCNGNNQFAPVCIQRHVLAVFVGSFGSQLFFSLTRAMNRDCWPVDIDLDLRLLELLQKRSCERFVMDLHNSPVALELCLNKFGRSPTGKRYQLRTRTVTVEEMANDFFLQQKTKTKFFKCRLNLPFDLQLRSTVTQRKWRQHRNTAGK